MITRLANIDDLPNLLLMGQVFCKESGWGWTYSEENALKSFYTAIVHPDMDIILTENEGKFYGACIVSIENDFQVENVGDILEFYVSPESRGTGASRELLKAVCDWFDERKCVRVFVKATANIESQGKAFENLFSKYGFKVFSSVLVR